MDDLLERAHEEYARLVSTPFISIKRHYQQSYMAFLRDFIAAREARDAEEVQSEFERRYGPK